MVKETLHSIIASRAEARIRSGAWPPGTRLPPERELCELLEVSRTSLRVALADLEERGLITRHQGRGTFVTRPRLDADASGFFSIADAMRSRGVEVSTRVVEATVVDANERQLEEFEGLDDPRLLRLRRVRLADGEPMVIEKSWLPLARLPGLEAADFGHRSLYDILREDHGCFVATAAETLEPVILTAPEATLLQVGRGSPALLFRRMTRDRGDRVVEIGEGLLRGDRSRFLIQRRVREGWTTQSGIAGSTLAATDEADSVRIAAGLLEDASIH
jgi:GntR family transcriptional regulator